MLIISKDILIQTPFSPNHDFSAAIRVDVKSGKVLGLLFGRSEASLETIMTTTRLRAVQSDQSPFDTMLLLLGEYGRFNEEWRAKLDRKVVSMEVRSGMTSLDTSNQQYADDVHIYEELTRDLHACNTDLTFLSDILSFEVELGAFCGKVFNVFEELEDQRGDAPFHDYRMHRCYQQRLAYYTYDSQLRQRQTTALKMRVQGQIKLVSSHYISKKGPFAD